VRTTHAVCGSGRHPVAWLLAATVFGSWPPAASAYDPDALASSLLAQVSEPAGRKKSLSAAQQKVDSVLRRYAWPAAATPRGQTAASPKASSDMPWRKEGRLRVIVKVTGTASAHAGALAAAGFDIEIVNDRFRLVQGWIADGALPTLAELEFVESVSPAWPAEHSAGTVTSEGDRASRADLVRQLGYDGSGVVVGVISDGIDSLATSQVSGDLPTVTVPPDPRCRVRSGDEGTAMLEIVHDLAPGAPLLFSGPSTSLEMIDTIACLTSAGADVIVDDLFFFDQPFFEDGPLAITAAAAVAAGVSYHTSAANYGNGKYLAEDYRAGPEDFHDFDPGPGQNILNLVAVPPGGVLRCFLQWADPFGASSNDYDLFAVEPATITILASSEDPQTGFEDPRETVVFANPLASLLVVGLAIQRFDGAPVALKLLCPDPGTPLEWSSSQFGISGHAARPEVLAVAAINALDPGLDDVEPFSMQGPAPIFFPSIMFRPKPDLAAFDGVATTLPGGGPFNPFYGTSAAAPHSAAVAALLLSKSPNLSPSQVQSILTSTAVDIDAPGSDNVAGHGRVDALAAINAVSGPTTTTLVSTTTTSTSAPGATTTTSASLPGTTSTTLPPCDPNDCDGSACTVGDACVAGQCQPGNPLTADVLSAAILEQSNRAAAAECAADRKKSVKKVRAPLSRTANLLRAAFRTANPNKARKKISAARKSTQRAATKLSKEQPRLSSACAAALDATIASAGSGLACLP
jgi:subtilisin family serine protease